MELNPCDKVITHQDDPFIFPLITYTKHSRHYINNANYNLLNACCTENQVESARHLGIKCIADRVIQVESDVEETAIIMFSILFLHYMKMLMNYRTDSNRILHVARVELIFPCMK